MKFNKLYNYLKERFPFVNMALFAILFLTVFSVARFFSTNVPAGFEPLDFLGIVAAIFFFFRLRVFDEVKDYAIDQINHPQRVLQSGQITLKELRFIAVIGTLVEFFWSMSMGAVPLMAWTAAFAFSLLMRYEFFAPIFLKKHLLLYALTHMLVMPLLILWIWLTYSSNINTGYFLLALLSLMGGFSFELARKIHVAGAERETIASYSRSMGFNAASIAVLAVLGAGSAVLAYLLFLIGSSIFSYLIIGLLYLATIFTYLSILNRPEEKKLRTAEILVSLFMLISYLSLIIEIYI